MKLAIRHINGAIHLDLVGETAHEFQEMRRFVELLNGKPVDVENFASNPVFDLPVRIESVGFDDDGSIESIALEGPSRS